MPSGERTVDLAVFRACGGVCDGRRLFKEISGWLPGGIHRIILVLLPLLLLAVTSKGQTQAFRYPVLIRYRDRNEFFYLKTAVRSGFVLLCLLAFAGMLFFFGRRMPVESGHAFIISEDFTGIVVRQCLNIFCFWSALLLLHEILQSIVSDTMLDLAVTTFVPLGNYILAKGVAVKVDSGM